MRQLLQARVAQGTLLVIGMILSGQFAFAQGVVTDFYQKDDKAIKGVIDPYGRLISAGYATGVAPSGKNGFAVTRHSCDGMPDSSFDGDGKAVVPNVKGSSDGASAVAIQADGKIVLAGNRSTTTSSWMIARMNANGSMDTSFASKGVFVKSLQNKASMQVASGLMIQPDGKIVAVGYLKPSLYKGALIRLNSNGSLDTGFGNSGVVIPTLPAYSWLFLGAIPQGDKILVSGYICWAAGAGTDLLLMRFNANGSIDTTFGNAGRATADFYEFDRAKRIALQSDGMILVATELSENGATWFGLSRFEADGLLDLSFGDNGLVETQITYSDTVETMAIQPDGKIVLGGNNIDYYTIMARYLPDGSPDPSFGTDGTVAEQVGLANDLQLQADGSIVLFGFDYTPGELNDFFLVRFLEDGSLDLGF